MSLSMPGWWSPSPSPSPPPPPSSHQHQHQHHHQNSTAGMYAQTPLIISFPPNGVNVSKRCYMLSTHDLSRTVHIRAHRAFINYGIYATILVDFRVGSRCSDLCRMDSVAALACTSRAPLFSSIENHFDNWGAFTDILSVALQLQ